MLFVALTALSALIAVNGGTRHMFYLEPAEMKRAVRLIYIAQPWGIMSVAFGKISAGLLIMRILSKTHKKMRISIWVMIVITAIANIVSAVTTFTQCDPPAALWDAALRATADCWDPSVQNNYNIFTSSWNTAVDFVLSLIPIRIIWGLKLRMRQRLGIVLLLSIGVFSGVCSAIKTAQLASLTARSDLTWKTYSLFLWVSSEIFVIVLCASVSTLKPLYDRLRGRRKMQTGSAISSGAYHFGKSSTKSRQRSQEDGMGPHILLSSFSENPNAQDPPQSQERSRNLPHNSIKNDG